MINLKYTKSQFNEFIKKYDMENEMIKLKVDHMIRVMKINSYFAKLQNLDEENIELAGVIGLLHDIGRFVQIEKYGIFIDSKSINHCEAGVKLLFEENLIENFVQDSKYYYTIEKAIENHGKYEIENNLDDKTLLHCKLIRDSDKTDIFEVMLRDNPYVVFDGDYDKNGTINPKVESDFFENKMINSADRKGVLDDFVRKVAFIYNYYFPCDLKYVKEQNYLNRMKDRFLESYHFESDETNKKIEQIVKYGNEFLEKQILSEN